MQSRRVVKVTLTSSAAERGGGAYGHNSPAGRPLIHQQVLETWSEAMPKYLVWHPQPPVFLQASQPWQIVVFTDLVSQPA
jgi:hypothetical protein